MTQREGFLSGRRLFWILRRQKGNGPNHWSVVRRKIAAKDKALEHFDEFYSHVYGSFWPSIRNALLEKTHKYVAVVNNLADVDKTIAKLQLQGAIDMKELYNVVKNNKERMRTEKLSESIYNVNLPVRPEDGQDISKMAVQKVKKEEEEEEEKEEERDGLAIMNEPFEPVQLRPLEEDLVVAKLDESRIIQPSTGLTASSLYEYIPASKLKGLDEYVLESDHYGYYTKSADFEIKVEKDLAFSFPEYLKIFTFESGNNSFFPSPRKGSTAEVLDYYLMDGGSILPVLALDVRPGDVILDMCAAPGGKSLIALQTLYPSVIVANDNKISRVNMINNVFEEYLGHLDVWNNRLFVTNQDARCIEDKNVYNKILVDVPCTTDRHSLHNDENNIFSPVRIKERLQLPEYQSSILMQALKIIPIGGTVVYATCSLSPIQNDGVVQMALKKNWEDSRAIMVVKDMSEWLEPFSTIYKFGGDDFGFKFGTVVLPTNKSNFGPTYFSKMVRVQ